MKKGFIQHHRNGAGFTLIELLVVISIIGILAALTLTGFNAARKNARDATRKSDLQQYRVALEAFASSYTGRYVYPYEATERGHGESCSDSGIFRNNGPIIPAYLSSKIADPKESCANGSCGGTGQCTYRYRAYTSGGKYFLMATLETGGSWIVCSDGRAGKVTTLPPNNWDPGIVGDVGVDNTCNAIGN